MLSPDCCKVCFPFNRKCSETFPQIRANHPVVQKGADSLMPQECWRFLVKSILSRPCAPQGLGNLCKLNDLFKNRLPKTVAVALCIAAALCLFAFSPAAADQVSVAWDWDHAPPDGFNVYARVAGGSYDYANPVWTGTTASATFYLPDDGLTRYLVVRVFQGSSESGNSNEVQYRPEVQQASPPEPLNSDTAGSGVDASEPVGAGGATAQEGFMQSGGDEDFVVLEAESFNANVTTGSHYWTPVSTPRQFSGEGAMRALPDSGERIRTGYVSSSPSLKFDVNFTRAGRHYLWVRCHADGNDNSLHAGLDGTGYKTAENITAPIRRAWVWTNQSNGDRAFIEVPAAGMHTLDIWMREDGLVLDKILLTTDPAYVPDGYGPNESIYADDGSNGINAGSSGVGTVGSDDAFKDESLGAPVENNSAGVDPTPYSSIEPGKPLVIEAEDFTLAKDSVTHYWEDVMLVFGYRGDGAVRAMPDDGVRVRDNYVNASPQLTFPVYIPSAGVYYLWLRGFAVSEGNSAHAGLDGGAVRTAKNITFPVTGDWGWTGQLGDGSPASLTFVNAGLHTIEIWMREDGLALDALLLTDDSKFIP
jgi:hypothetical protein